MCGINAWQGMVRNALENPTPVSLLFSNNISSSGIALVFPLTIKDYREALPKRPDWALALFCFFKTLLDIVQ